MKRILHLQLSLLLASTAAAAPGPQDGPAVDREAMWPAPTAEDWAEPCRITWQRTFEDALAVSQQTLEPVLICVNMDGEIASEHYAGIRYRQPDIAALYEPYVCVIASVYRHTPRDHDEDGRRIPCPRFGTVTCGEHIAIEPGLFEKFFEGKRIAPRHIAVELDRQEVYDVYYAWDTETIFRSLREGIEGRDVETRPLASADRPIVERVASPDVGDREAIEAAFQAGDRRQRRTLLEATLRHRDVDQLEMLRLALFGLDVELSRLARQALARCQSEAAIDLIGEALRIPMEESEREELIASLERLGETWPRARTLAVVHRGLDRPSQELDVASWTSALEDAPSPAYGEEQGALGARLEYQAQNTRARPEDAGSRLDLAEAYVALAAEPDTGPRYARLLLEDARRAAREAEELGSRGWRVDATLALTSYHLGEPEEALARAEAAVRSMPPGATEWSAMAVLALFAESRREAIRRAARAGEEWPPEWLTDVHAAFSVLARHPLGNDEQVAAHVDFLTRLGAGRQATRALEDGLARFPDSWALHERLRGRILWQKGAEGLEAVYAARLSEEDAPTSLMWFAGYASLVAAESHRRAGEGEKAWAAYGRAMELYERCIEASDAQRDSADHYVAIAHAGRARLALEARDDDAALQELVGSFARSPEAAASLDGLGISAVDTAYMLRARLVEPGREVDLAALDVALDALDPELLLLPAYERDVSGRGGAGRRPPRRRDGAGR